MIDPISFGSYVYDPERNLLTNGGGAVPISRRGLLLLGFLLQHRGRVLLKAELLNAAWPGEAVHESNLSVQIATLRKHIGAEWIRTVERVGYEFIVRLSRLTLRAHGHFPRPKAYTYRRSRAHAMTMMTCCRPCSSASTRARSIPTAG